MRPVCRFVLALMVIVASCAHSQSRPAAPWGAIRSLLGQWRSDSGSGGSPGVALRGGEDWQVDSSGHTVVRRYFSEYGATNSRPAFRHEGVTIFSRRPGGSILGQDSDNEGHAIDYDVTMPDSAVVLTSVAASEVPRYRLTFSPRASGYHVIFEIAMPNEPTVFRKYVEGGLHRP
jgi:hypothetical protein